MNLHKKTHYRACYRVIRVSSSAYYISRYFVKIKLIICNLRLFVVVLITDAVSHVPSIT